MGFFFLSQNIIRIKHEIYLRTRDIYIKKKDFVYSSAFFSGNKNKDDSIKLKLIYLFFILMLDKIKQYKKIN